MGSQRVGHDWTTFTFTFSLSLSHQGSPSLSQKLPICLPKFYAHHQSSCNPTSSINNSMFVFLHQNLIKPCFYWSHLSMSIIALTVVLIWIFLMAKKCWISFFAAIEWLLYIFLLEVCVQNSLILFQLHVLQILSSHTMSCLYII